MNFYVSTSPTGHKRWWDDGDVARVPPDFALRAATPDEAALMAEILRLDVAPDGPPAELAVQLRALMVQTP